MSMRIDGGQPAENKTGFSMEQLKEMSKEKLLSVFDTNGSGSVSDKEITSKGFGDAELQALRSYMDTQGVEKEVRMTKTGFTMDEFNAMTDKQLLGLFDKNSSGTISEQELKAKGIGDEFMAELKAKVSSLGIEETEKAEKKEETAVNLKPADNKTKTVREKKKVEGVTFYADEVKKVEYSSYKNFWTGRMIKTVKVTTPYGVFEYFPKDNNDFIYHIDNSNGSVLGNRVKDLILHSYTGTNKNDKLYLKSSELAHINIEGGGKDIIYYDKDSCVRDVSYWHHDDIDEIRFQKEDGSWQVEKNPYR